MSRKKKLGLNGAWAPPRQDMTYTAPRPAGDGVWPSVGIGATSTGKMPSVGAARRPHQYDRGRLMTAEEIHREIFRGHRTIAWVRKHVAPGARHDFGRLMWYEYDVRDWIAEQRDAV